MAREAREVERLGAWRALACSVAIAGLASTATACPPAELDFVPLDASADAGAPPASDAASSAVLPSLDASSGAPPVDARVDEATPELIAACAPQDPGCQPCAADHSCPAGECRPGFNYCVECTKNCLPGETCVDNQCLTSCGPNNPCHFHEQCDPNGFCRSCDYNFSLCDTDQVCRRQTGQCVDCVSDNDCAFGQACGVAFTCYDAGADGGNTGLRDH